MFKFNLPETWDASIHFPLAREDRNLRCAYIRYAASIHFPLAREDAVPDNGLAFPGASIHFPLAREDFISTAPTSSYLSLQSTSLLRGKTEISDGVYIAIVLQSTSLLRGTTKRM